MITGTPIPISQLPTGTIDSIYDVLPVTIGITGTTPQTIQATLLQVANILQSNGLMISGSYAGIDARYLNQAHINGLNLNYVTSGSISVNPGSAYIPSLGRYSIVTGTITQSIPIVASNATGTWQNVYLYENSGVPSIQVTGTAVSVPYSGVARTKNGDTSMRYIGSVFCDAGGYLHRFASEIYGNVEKINWISNQNGTVFQPMPSGTSATNPTTLPIGHLIPAVGVASEIHTNLALSLGGGNDFLAAVGETILSSSFANNFQSAEVYVRNYNASTGTSVVSFLPSSPIKISSNSIQFMTLQVLGTNAYMDIRIRGVTLQR
jgi:hypothetical protein